MNRRDDESIYRWYILGLAALTAILVVAMPSMCMPVLFPEISLELGLNLVQIGAIWGMGSLAGLFTSLLGGSIGDWLGAPRTLCVGCLLVGVTGALRGLSNSFATLAMIVFLGGLVGSILPMTIHKTCGIWFSGRHLGLANGIISMGMAIGFITGSMVSATLLSPWLGGWRNVLYLYGANAIVVSIPWALSRRGPGDGKTSGSDATTISMRHALSHVFRLKSVWLLGWVMLGIGGCIQGVLGYLPLYLRASGWASVNADGALAAFHGMSLMAVVPIALLSDRLGSRKKILVVATLMITVGTVLMSQVNGPLVWVGILMAGSVRDGFMAVYMAMIMDIEEVGALYAGTATGLAASLSRVGSMIAPPLGNSLAIIHPGLPFVLWAVMASLGFLGFYFIKERAVKEAQIDIEFGRV